MSVSLLTTTAEGCSFSRARSGLKKAGYWRIFPVTTSAVTLSAGRRLSTSSSAADLVELTSVNMIARRCE